MFKSVIFVSFMVACTVAAPAPGVLALPGPIVTAHSSQVVARTYNAAFPVLHAAPVVAAPAPVLHAAPVLAAPAPVVHAAPVLPAPLVHAAPAPLVHAAPALAAPVFHSAPYFHAGAGLVAPAPLVHAAPGLAAPLLAKPLGAPAVYSPYSPYFL